VTFILKMIYRLLPSRIQNVLIQKVYVKNSNSQAGEDRILGFLFEMMGIDSIVYIDIGANHPVISNNTYTFYENGSRGVIIEPDPGLYGTLNEIRPNDIIVQAAVNDIGQGTTDFYLFNNSQLNTLSKKEALFRQENGSFEIVDTIKTKYFTIEDIILEYLDGKNPDLISLDVEGVDYDILRSFDFQSFPVPIFIIETCMYSETHIKEKVTDIFPLMLSKGYFVYADTYVNTIFINKDWFYNYSK